jgi:hypothetical protein
VSIYVLARALAGEYAFDPEAVELFQSAFRAVVDTAFAQYARPFTGRLDPHINRFATARFELNVLLADFQKGFAEIRKSIGFTEVLKRLVVQKVVSLLDARAATCILASPTRLTFSNSMVWSSFITALTAALGFPFTITMELCQALQMAPSICSNPRLVAEVCPDVNPQIILFLLTSLKPDELLATNIDASRFVSVYRLDPTFHPMPIEPLPVGDYMKYAAEIRITDWNACTMQPELLNKFPHLSQFLKTV